MLNVSRISCLLFICLLGLTQTAVAEDTPSFVPGSWTMVVLPDTQRYTDPTTDPGLQTFGQITQWIADNKQSRNIKFVLQEGDITGGNTAATWQVASNAMAILDTASVPYSLATGNHDYDQWIPAHQNSPGRDTLLNNYFPVSWYQAMSTYGGVFEPGKTQNNYHLFSAGGKDYITMALEWGPRNETLAWADGVLTQHADRTALIVTHAYTYSDGTRYDWAAKGTAQNYNPHCASYAFSTPHDGTENVNDGQQIWDKLISKHQNASMVFSGHVPWAGARQTVVGDHGQVVHEMVAAYHDPPQGWVRLLEFNPDGETVQVKTYSPKLDQYMTDDSQQFILQPPQPPKPMGIKDSVDFNIKTFEGDTADPAGWTRNSSGSAIETNGGILTWTTPVGANHVYWEQGIGSAWQSSVSGTKGFTVEIRAKINAQQWSGTTAGVSPLGLVPSGSTGRHDMFVSSNGFMQRQNPDDGSATSDNLMDSGDNTDDFHVFRIAREGDAFGGKATFWRDGILVAKDVIGLEQVSPEMLFYIGDTTGLGMNGSVSIDYVRMDTTGAYAPVTMPGDANHDGKVDAADAEILAENWQRTGDAFWEHGDFNGDGHVDDRDATMLAANWQTGVPASASVPEPSVLIGLLCMGPALLAAKRK